LGYIAGAQWNARPAIPSVILQITTTTATIFSTRTTTDYVQTGSVASSPSALEVYVNTNTTGMGPVQQTLASVWENNTLPLINNVSALSDYAIPNLSFSPCAGGFPLEMGLLQGHYGMGNFSEGQFVSPIVFSCTTDYADYQYFVFSPLNGTAVAHGVQTQPSGPFSERLADVSFNYTYTGLGPGEYTVVGGDEWGHVAFAYFSVAA